MKKNDATLKELQTYLENQTGVKVAPSNFCRFLQKRQLTLKKNQATQAAPERVQNLRVQYWQQVKDIEPSNLFFWDETGINLALARLWGRSFRGTRAYSQQPFYPGVNITLIGAITLRGFLGVMTFDGGTNSVAF